MNSSAIQEVNSLAPSPVVSKKQRSAEQEILERITFEEALGVVNELIFAQRGRYLSKAEITVMKGTWANHDYEEIAENSRYTVNYLQRVVATRLWVTLSKTLGNGERVTKKTLRNFLEQVTEEHYVKSVSNGEQLLSVNKLLQIKGRGYPDVSSFYGRAKELSRLKESIFKKRCVLLIGVAGIGKSALAAKLLEELSIESQPRFDSLIWKSVAHAPLLEDLVTDLLELIHPSQSGSELPQYGPAMISLLIKQLQSHQCLIVLDECETLFHISDLKQRLEFKLFFRRLVEELDHSCLLLTSRILPDELNDLIEIKRPVEFLKIEDLDRDAAMQFLASQGFTNQEKCIELIETYRGNPSELKALANRIHHFFGSNEAFFEHKTTLISSQFQAMLDQMFGQVLNELHREIMICLAEELILNSQPISFTKLLNGLNNKHKVSISTSELITALEKLERHSLIEAIKSTIHQEISFTLQPVIKKYVKTDPLGLVRASHALPTLANAS